MAVFQARTKMQRVQKIKIFENIILISNNYLRSPRSTITNY